MDFNCELAVFDLDGTLVKSHKSIYYATLRTFEEIGMNVKMPENKFYNLIGHHFTEIFAEFDVVVDDIEGFINIYKTFYFDYIDYSTPYDGMFDVLDYLNRNEIKVGLLTTKSQEQAERILKHFNIYKQFNYVMGRRPNVGIKPSAEPLEIIISELNCKDKSNCLMIGDSELDINCGQNAGTKTVAVTYGYRTLKDLEKEKPSFIINKLNELKKIIDPANFK